MHALPLFQKCIVSIKTSQSVANYGTEKAFDMQNQVTGIYFCKVTFADGQIAAQKIIKE
jgi:hypothetical protein